MRDGIVVTAFDLCRELNQVRECCKLINSKQDLKSGEATLEADEVVKIQERLGMYIGFIEDELRRR